MIKILKSSEVSIEEILKREDFFSDVSENVRDIIANVRKNGDKALRKYTYAFDGVKLDSFEVSEEEMQEAVKSVGSEFLLLISRASENIKKFHEAQLREGFKLEEKDGITVGQKISPIEKVGIYVPGGTAPLSSTVLMTAIPAMVAGCEEIILVSPPGKDGKIDAHILAAAKTAGVTKIFKIGGAQAIAALAYGTESIPKVYKIVGPGNAYVAEAKKQVFGKVSIDMIAGPSEILVIADGKSNPCFVAADLISQAEHDKNASAVLITDSEDLAKSVGNEIKEQLEILPRKDIASASFEKNGKIIITKNILEAVDIANEIAPEHLELCVNEPFKYLDLVKNAGSVFLGRMCPEAVGDYYAGPNHTLPTGGSAKFSSPLSVDDFIKKTQYIYYSENALKNAASDIALFAESEELLGHKRSVTVRAKI